MISMGRKKNNIKRSLHYTFTIRYFCANNHAHSKFLGIFDGLTYIRRKYILKKDLLFALLSSNKVVGLISWLLRKFPLFDQERKNFRGMRGSSHRRFRVTANISGFRK